jgi:hypothetical protein
VNICVQCYHECILTRGWNKDTLLPAWFPLSNLQLGQHSKVLSMLNMKRDHNGTVVYDGNSNKEGRSTSQTSNASTASTTGTSGATGLSSFLDPTFLPMQPRPKRRYQIGVLGGGIAGLACCQELMQQLEQEKIDAQIILVEGTPSVKQIYACACSSIVKMPSLSFCVVSPPLFLYEYSSREIGRTLVDGSNHLFVLRPSSSREEKQQ